VSPKKNRKKTKIPPSTDGHRRAPTGTDETKKNNEEPKKPPKTPQIHPRAPTNSTTKQKKRRTKKSTIHRRAPTGTDETKKNTEEPKNPPKSTDGHRRAPTLVLYLVPGMFLVQPFFFWFFDGTKKNGSPGPQVETDSEMTGGSGVSGR